MSLFDRIISVEESFIFGKMIVKFLNLRIVYITCDPKQVVLDGMFYKLKSMIFIQTNGQMLNPSLRANQKPALQLLIIRYLLSVVTIGENEKMLEQ